MLSACARHKRRFDNMERKGLRACELSSSGGNAAFLVEWSAFLVMTKEQGDSLRLHDTDICEVVRCDIKMLDDEILVEGLTFRFIPAAASGTL